MTAFGPEADACDRLLTSDNCTSGMTANGRFQSDAIGGIRSVGPSLHDSPPLTAFKVSHLFCVYELPDQDVWVCFLQ